MTEHTTLFLPGIYGQYKLWKNVLTSYADGADKVIQLGNIIGCNEVVKDSKNRGPNEGALKQVYSKIQTHKEWVQIIGVNEIAALNYPDEWTNSDSNALLRNGWFHENPIFKVAAVDKNRLITHAGLSFGEWQNIGSPQTAQEAADALNEKYMHTLHQGPAFNLNDIPSFEVNPIWGHAAMEVYPSWMTRSVPMPFDQIHGGESLNNLVGREILGDDNGILKHIDSVRMKNYGSAVTIHGMQITSVDMELNRDLVSSIPRPKTLYMETIKN